MPPNRAVHAAGRMNGAIGTVRGEGMNALLEELTSEYSAGRARSLSVVEGALGGI